MNIYESMAKAMSEIDAIGKDKVNQQQGFKYRGIDQVYNALNPVLARNGIFMTPKVLNSEREERVNKNGTTLFYSRVTMEYSFMAVDGTSVTCSIIGEGMDSGDKATNKAMAVAHKYALLQTFCIPTEDMPDPDSEVHSVMPKEEPKQPPKATILFNKLKAHYKCDDKTVKDMLSFAQITSKDTAKIDQALNDFGGLVMLLDEGQR